MSCEFLKFKGLYCRVDDVASIMADTPVPGSVTIHTGSAGVTVLDGAEAAALLKWADSCCCCDPARPTAYLGSVQAKWDEPVKKGKGDK